MKYNALFEYVIRTSGENTDDIDDFDDRDNFWAPVPVIEQMFERILREAIEEALIDEEKDAHERHINTKGFEWYYFGASIEEINETLNEYKEHFNKEARDINGNLVKYGSYRITDDKTNETIGWLNYIIQSVENKNGIPVKSINTVKIKQEIPNSENDCLQQTIKHFMELFQNDIISSITWEAININENKRIKQYCILCQKFGGTINSEDDRIIFSIPREAFYKNKNAILRYFRLN